MIFDTHTHYDDADYAEDLPAVLQAAKEAGVGTIVNVGSTIESNARCLELAERYPQVYCALGVHPSECADMTEAVLDDLRARLTHPKAVAVGEIGLDYYWDNVDRAVQKHWFVRQLELAAEVDKPVVIHSREAAEDTFRTLEEHFTGTGVIHCYSYSPEMALRYVRRGYFIGVGGVVTYKNAKKLVETVEAVPLEAIVTETDCPYLSPEPLRGRRNHSGNLPYIIRRIAQLKGVAEEEVVRVTEENARRLYRL